MEGQITQVALKMTFLYRFFPLELRERKMKDFINLRQGGVSMTEYSLKFPQVFKYARTILVWPLFIVGQGQ